MPRRPRVILPDVPLHIIQRGNNRQACFFTDDDYRFYLEWLCEYAKEMECRVHAYVLMTNHAHLLLTPREAKSAGQLMKRLGQRYVQYINRTYHRSGTLWEGRFRSCLVQTEAYLLECHRYIELNPVRAGIVAHPAEYPWSSYRRNAQGKVSDLLVPHAVYRALGGTWKERAAAYRELFRHQLHSGVIDEIRGATSGNYVLGDDRFRAEIEKAVERRVVRGKPGRPKKVTESGAGGLFGG